MNETLQQNIDKKPNDRTGVEELFREKTGIELIVENDQPEGEINCGEFVSVVISCYMGHKTLPYY